MTYITEVGENFQLLKIQRNRLKYTIFLALLIFELSNQACVTRGSTPVVAAGCNLEKDVLKANYTHTFDYGQDGIINPVYYSSDDCNNAYVIFNWKIPSLFSDVDDYKAIHYCLYGYDDKPYTALTATSDPYITLNLIGLPVNANNLFEVKIYAVIQTYKGYTGIIARKLYNLPKKFEGLVNNLLTIAWTNPDISLTTDRNFNFHKNENMFFGFSLALKPQVSPKEILPPVLSFIYHTGVCKLLTWFECEVRNTGLTSIKNYFQLIPVTQYEDGKYFTFLKVPSFAPFGSTVDYYIYQIGGALVQFLKSDGTMFSFISPTLDFRSLGSSASSSCAGYLTYAAMGGSFTYTQIKVHLKYLQPLAQNTFQLSCVFYQGQFELRINDQSFYSLFSGKNYVFDILDPGFQEMYIFGYAMSGQSNPNFMCQVTSACFKSSNIFYPQRTSQADFPQDADVKAHETLFNLTQVYYNAETKQDCIPALKVSTDISTPCITLGGKNDILKPLISLYGLEFNGTKQAILTDPHKIFRTDRLWCYAFEIYLFDERYKQTIFTRYTPADLLWQSIYIENGNLIFLQNFNETYTLLTGIQPGWNWIMVVSDISVKQIMWAYLIDERGNYKEKKKFEISMRVDDSDINYNLYGNRLDYSAPFAGIFRFIQLENDYVLNFDEFQTYFTTNCKGSCKRCRVDNKDVTPTAYPNNLPGTCFDDYGGQDYMNFNFTEKHDVGITGELSQQPGSKITTGGRRMLFNKYDLVMGQDGKNLTQYPKKIGFQGYYFNGSSILSSKEYVILPQSFTFEVWFKFTEQLNGTTKEGYFSLFQLRKPDSPNGKDPYFDVSFMDKRNTVIVQMQGKKTTFDNPLSQMGKYINRWSFMGISVMNLKSNIVKICLDFPPVISDCNTRFSSIYFDAYQAYKVTIGDRFRGIIRSIRIANWPKLDIHFKSEYKVDTDCIPYGDDPVCNVCSTEYNNGQCFPSCDLNFAPSSQYPECSACKPAGLCLHCDDSNEVQYCSTCQDQSFTDPRTGCTPCDLRCKTCRGGNYFDCLSCFPGYETYLGTCREKCGDGKDYQELECDDGNSVSGDGCSQNCTIEDTYYCQGGTINNPDLCSVRPFANLTISKDLKYLTASFTKPLKIWSPKSSNLDYKIIFSINDDSNYLIDWSLQTNVAVPVQKLVFKISYDDEDMFQSNKYLTLKYNLTFLNQLRIKDVNNVTLYNSSVYTSTQIRPMSYFVDQDYSILQTGLILGFSLSSLSAIFLQKGIDMIMGLVDFMQLINLIPLMPLNLPSHTRTLFKILSFSNMELGLFRKMYTFLYGDGDYNQQDNPFNENYDEYDIF
eukprot:403350981